MSLRADIFFFKVRPLDRARFLSPQDNTRLLVHLDTVKANFSVVENLGSCYLSVRGAFIIVYFLPTWQLH